MTEQDLLLLSAYIDDELAEAERRALESRLATEPELQAELTALQQTVALIQQMPIRQAPRNYTITPAMVQDRRRRIIPLPWAVAAAAALTLIIGIVIINPFASDEESSSVGQATTTEQQEIADAPSPEVLPTKESFANGSGGAGGGNGLDEKDTSTGIITPNNTALPDTADVTDTSETQTFATGGPADSAPPEAPAAIAGDEAAPEGDDMTFDDAALAEEAPPAVAEDDAADDFAREESVESEAAESSAEQAPIAPPSPLPEIDREGGIAAEVEPATTLFAQLQRIIVQFIDPIRRSFGF